MPCLGVIKGCCSQSSFSNVPFAPCASVDGDFTLCLSIVWSFHLISFLIVFPLPLYPRNNSCLEDSTVSDFSLIWFLILSGLDTPALVCYFNLIHQSPLLYRVALVYHVGGKTTVWCSWSPMQSQAGHVCEEQRGLSASCCAKPRAGAEHRGLVLARAAGERRGLCRLRTGCVMQCNGNFIYHINTLFSGCWRGSFDPFVTPVLQIMDCFGV